MKNGIHIVWPQTQNGKYAVPTPRCKNGSGELIRQKCTHGSWKMNRLHRLNSDTIMCAKMIENVDGSFICPRMAVADYRIGAKDPLWRQQKRDLFEPVTIEDILSFRRLANQLKMTEDSSCLVNIQYRYVSWYISWYFHILEIPGYAVNRGIGTIDKEGELSLNHIYTCIVKTSDFPRQDPEIRLQYDKKNHSPQIIVYSNKYLPYLPYETTIPENYHSKSQHCNSNNKSNGSWGRQN